MSAQSASNPPQGEDNQPSATKSKYVLAGLLVLAIVIIAVLFNNVAEQRKLTESYREGMESKEAELEKVLDEQGRDALASREAERRAKAAEESRRMLTEAMDQEQERKSEALEMLNERLAQEAEAREKAEASLRELNEKIERLDRMIAENEAQIPGGSEAMNLQKIREEVDSLNEEVGAVEAMAERARQRQIETEEAILEGGGDITIQGYRILSPNYKRNEAVLWKERAQEGVLE